jgi:hypothetical protein
MCILLAQNASDIAEGDAESAASYENPNRHSITYEIS